MSFIKYNKIERDFNNNKGKELDKLIEDIINGEINISYRDIEPDKKAIFTAEYREQNNNPECDSCKWPRCFLQKDYECVIIGIKIEEVSSRDNVQIYNIKKIKKRNPFIKMLFDND